LARYARQHRGEVPFTKSSDLSEPQKSEH